MQLTYNKQIAIAAGVAGLVIGLIAGVVITIAALRDHPDPQGPAVAQMQTPERAPTIEAKPTPDFDAEYRRAALTIHFAVKYQSPSREFLRARLLDGLPIGAIGSMEIIRPMWRWLVRLSPAAREEYARRCLDLASKIRSGEEPRAKGLSPPILDPLSLYATAYNVSQDGRLQDRAARLFYTEADRLHEQLRVQTELHNARIARDGVAIPDPRSPDGFTITGAGTPSQPPPRERLLDWHQLLLGRAVAIPDPR